MVNLQAAARGGVAFSVSVYCGGGGYLYSRGITVIPSATATLAAIASHKIPNLGEESYDVNYDYNGRIGPFYNTVADEDNPDFYE